MSENKHRQVVKEIDNNFAVGSVKVINVDPTEDENINAPEQTTYGMVVKCEKLNVREKPESGAKIICTIDAWAEVIIDMANSIGKWFKICTESGIEGYCMNDFIQIK